MVEQSVPPARAESPAPQQPGSTVFLHQGLPLEPRARQPQPAQPSSTAFQQQHATQQQRAVHPLPHASHPPLARPRQGGGTFLQQVAAQEQRALQPQPQAPRPQLSGATFLAGMSAELPRHRQSGGAGWSGARGAGGSWASARSGTGSSDGGAHGHGGGFVAGAGGGFGAGAGGNGRGSSSRWSEISSLDDEMTPSIPRDLRRPPGAHGPPFTEYAPPVATPPSAARGRPPGSSSSSSSASSRGSGDGIGEEELYRNLAENEGAIVPHGLSLERHLARLIFKCASNLFDGRNCLDRLLDL